jgi:VWFA-related protein
VSPLLLAAAAASLAPQAQAPPEFRSDVRLIRLDVSVVDGVGRAVPGLRAEDFEVREDGRKVPLVYFEAIAPGEPLSADAAAAAAAEAAPPQRRVLLLVDLATMSHGQVLRSRASVARFLRVGTREGDWVRLANLSSGRAWDGRMPEDRERLSRAAATLARGPLLFGEDGVLDAIQDRVENLPDDGPSTAETSGQFLSIFAEAMGLLDTLESLIVQLGGVPGRKAIVLVSPGFPQWRNLRERLERVATLARESATTIYFVDAAGLDGVTPEPGVRLRSPFEAAWARSGGAQELAEATGGYASRFSANLTPALTRIGDELRTYYVVGYAPTRPDDGRFRSVRVRVRSDGLSARTKRGYLAGMRPAF